VNLHLTDDYITEHWLSAFYGKTTFVQLSPINEFPHHVRKLDLPLLLIFQLLLAHYRGAGIRSSLSMCRTFFEKTSVKRKQNVTLKVELSSFGDNWDL